MADQADAVRIYAASRGFAIQTRTVLVEGTTDAELFSLAARLERTDCGIDLFGNDFAVIAAGEGDRGGVSGVVRELHVLRALARTTLLPNGRPRYRFMGLVDNDGAGRGAVTLARQLDTSILEYKDVIRLHPVVPGLGNLDPTTVRAGFEHANDQYKGLNWELEDLLHPEFVDAFRADYPQAISRSTNRGNKRHCEFTRDGKAEFHRFVRRNAMREDVAGVIDVLRVLRQLMGLSRQDREIS